MQKADILSIVEAEIQIYDSGLTSKEKRKARRLLEKGLDSEQSLTLHTLVYLELNRERNEKTIIPGKERE